MHEEAEPVDQVELHQFVDQGPLPRMVIAPSPSAPSQSSEVSLRVATNVGVAFRCAAIGSVSGCNGRKAAIF